MTEAPLHWRKVYKMNAEKMRAMVFWLRQGYSLHNPPRLACFLSGGLNSSNEQLMVSGGRSAHQSELGRVCPHLIHREERRSLLGDDKETIIANVDGEFELASHAGSNITEDHGHGKERQQKPRRPNRRKSSIK